MSAAPGNMRAAIPTMAISVSAGRSCIRSVMPVSLRLGSGGAASCGEVQAATARQYVLTRLAAGGNHVSENFTHSALARNPVLIEFINDLRAVKNSLELSYITLPRCARILGKKMAIPGSMCW